MYVATGDQFSAALTQDGGMFTWGRNDDGVLGLGTQISIDQP